MSVANPLLSKLAAADVARRYGYPVADRILEAYGIVRCRSFDIRNSVALVATGRGGSTWLAELVTQLPNRVLLWEPLHLGNNPAIARHGLGWNPYLPVGSEHPEFETYLRKLLTGNALNTRTLTSLNFDLRALLAPRGFVVKFVQAHGIMPWFSRLFPVPIVGMIRHPCAVVASQLKHGKSWRNLTKENIDVNINMLRDYPHMEAVFDRIGTTVEALAFEWALKTYFLLQTDRRLLLTYEAMVAEPWKEAERVFAYLEEPTPSGILGGLEAPSATTHHEANYDNWEDRLRGWQRQLSHAEQDQILGVAHDMRVTLYGAGLYPDTATFEPIRIS